MRRLALVLPFLISPFAARLAINPISNALAGAAMVMAPSASASASMETPPIAMDDEQPDDSSPTPKNLRPARRERHASSSSSSARSRMAAGVERGSDAGPPPSSSPSSPKAPALDATSHGTIVVPASVIAKAIEKKDVGATNATGPDGKPLGARIHGASRYRAGLRDGDVIVFVAGTRTETTRAMVDAATRSLASGATKLSGKILRSDPTRGDEMWDVVLELPPRE